MKNPFTWWLYFFLLFVAALIGSVAIVEAHDLILALLKWIYML